MADMGSQAKPSQPKKVMGTDLGSVRIVVALSTGLTMNKAQRVKRSPADVSDHTSVYMQCACMGFVSRSSSTKTEETQ